jgi:hypothetical protein
MGPTGLNRAKGGQLLRIGLNRAPPVGGRGCSAKPLDQAPAKALRWALQRP